MDAAEALVPIAKALEAKVQAPETDGAKKWELLKPVEVPETKSSGAKVEIPGTKIAKVEIPEATSDGAKVDVPEASDGAKATVPEASQEEEDGGWWEEGEEEEWYEGDEEEHLEEDEEQWEQWDGQAVVDLTDSPPPKAPASQT